MYGSEFGGFICFIGFVMAIGYLIGVFASVVTSIETAKDKGYTDKTGTLVVAGLFAGPLTPLAIAIALPNKNAPASVSSQSNDIASDLPSL